MTGLRDKIRSINPLAVKIISRISDTIGLIYLASFIMNTGLLWFFMRTTIVCNFIDRGLVYVDCGHSIAGHFLNVFFLYFSPLVAQIMRGNTNRILYDPSPLTQIEFLPVMFFFIVSWLVIFCCAFTLRRIIRGFVRYRSFPGNARRSWLMLTVILLPALLSFSVRFYMVPPKFITRNIHVDIWHGAFDVPRNLLDEWSLVTPERLPLKPDDYASVLSRKWKWVPFLEFDFPDAVPMLTMPKASAIHVNPHYETLEPEKMQQERDRIAGLRLRKTIAETGLPAYEAVKEIHREWEIHKAKAETDDFFADIYLWRDTQGRINRMLECTPDKYCASIKPFKWVNYQCVGEEDCIKNCGKICTDRSLGTKDYDVVYSFDKKYLDRFEEIHAKIIAYVAQFYKPE